MQARSRTQPGETGNRPCRHLELIDELLHARIVDINPHPQPQSRPSRRLLLHRRKNADQDQGGERCTAPCAHAHELRDPDHLPPGTTVPDRPPTHTHGHRLLVDHAEALLPESLPEHTHGPLEDGAAPLHAGLVLVIGHDQHRHLGALAQAPVAEAARTIISAPKQGAGANLPQTIEHGCLLIECGHPRAAGGPSGPAAGGAAWLKRMLPSGKRGRPEVG